MIEHVRVLGAVLFVRALAEIGLGLYLVLVSRMGSAASRWLRLHAVPEPGDLEVFLALGAFLLLLASARLVQATCSLLTLEWGRRAGIFLALFDFVTPVTLVLAFWALVVYRHPETRDCFQRHRLRRGRLRAARRGAIEGANP